MHTISHLFHDGKDITDYILVLAFVTLALCTLLNWFHMHVFIWDTLSSLVTYVPHLHTFHPSSGPRRSSDRQVLLLRFLIRPFFMPFLHRWGIQEMLQPNHLLLSGFQSSTSATRPSASVAVSLFVSPSLQTKLRKFTQYSSLLILKVLQSPP